MELVNAAMKRNTYFFLFLILSACFTASCSDTKSKTETELTAEINRVAPDFSLKDISGKDILLSGQKGKVVLLEFWATWCPPCRASVPELIELQKKYQGRNFTVIGISIDSDSDLSKVVQFASANKINYPILIADDSTQKAYGIISVPTYYLINKDGVITDSYQGLSENFRTKISGRIENLL